MTPEIRAALALWGAAAENAHGANARKTPLLITAQLIEAGDKLAEILRDMTEATPGRVLGTTCLTCQETFRDIILLGQHVSRVHGGQHQAGDF
jgi:hypothetical protein